MNIADKKAISGTIVAYIFVLSAFTLFTNLLNRLDFISNNPEIAAIISLLLVVAASFTRMPTEISFLICGILASFILNIPLTEYVGYLWKHAGSQSIFMIAVSAALMSFIARGDLLDRYKKTDKLKNPDLYIDTERQVSIFCLFYKLQQLIEKVRLRSRFFAMLLFLMQSMMLFVSSVVTASTFSTMLKKDSYDNDYEKNYLNAGILCMCVSGCLLVFFLLKSPWWLFFMGFADKQNISVTYPISTLLYAIFSFIHGYFLIFKHYENKNIKKEKTAGEVVTKRYFYIYVGLIIVFLVFTLPASMKMLLNSLDDSQSIQLSIMTVLLIATVAVLISTVITRKIMLKSQKWKTDSDVIFGMRKLAVGDVKSDTGIKSVVSILLLIITILGFRDMISKTVDGAGASGLAQAVTVSSPWEGWLPALGCYILILVVVSVIGYLLGSNFGTFSIGFIIFNIVAARVALLNHPIWLRWMFESMIIISTFWNQYSPVSSNTAAITGKGDLDVRQVSKDAWSVKSVFNMSAAQIQFVAMLCYIILSGLLTFTGIE